MKPAAMGPSTTNRQTVEKEKAETKRLVHFHCFLIKQILNTSALELGLEYTIPLAMRLKLCNYMQKNHFSLGGTIIPIERLAYYIRD
jgi:hypothetical protein